MLNHPQKADAYKYLGLEFEDTLKWDITQRKLLAKAQSKVALLCKAVSEGLSLKAAENIWWAMVVPTLNYGSEIWGDTKFYEAEKLQIATGRKMLRVSCRTATT